jgi:2-polyprenyl-6-methoxyphenol hydroxylase-like FAD-dependent oxidoreductase
MPVSEYPMAVDNGSPRVLICGAGPTGLVLALWLAKRRVPFRIIDKAPHAGIASRALVVQARTLEFYRMLGVDKVIVDQARKVDQLRLWVRQRHVGTVLFNRAATGISAFPNFYVFPQDEHERVLEAELEKLGVHVERNTELVSFKEEHNGIDAQLKRTGGETSAGEISTVRVAYLAGCDGSRSRVREIIGAAFPGGTYDPIYYVADIIASGPVINGGLNLALDEADFLAVFPMTGEGRVRLVGTIDSDQPDRQFQWDDVSQDIIRRLQIETKTVNWFSTYRVHHRVASFFRKCRAVLFGDAAHVHIPVGGQGMYTGIGDANNLAWKLDAVLRRNTPETILDTYEQERIPFAKSLVNTTDRVFTFVNKRSALATAIRTRVVPLIVPRLFQSPAIRRAAFRLVSQTRIHYPKSDLTAGAAGHLHGGDRLPWLNGEDNYAPLTTLDWQLHCYGPIPAWCRNIDVHPFAPGGPIQTGTLCLIRPDGYIGWIGNSEDQQGLIAYCTKLNLNILY